MSKMRGVVLMVAASVILTCAAIDDPNEPSVETTQSAFTAGARCNSQNSCPRINDASVICRNQRCDYTCNSQFKACGTTCIPRSSCCSIADCAVKPNATTSCISNACVNSCKISTLSTSCLNGGLSCGTWDFESGTEGWSYFIHPGDGGSSAVAGPLAASTGFARSGLRSLAMPFRGDGLSTNTVRVIVPLCSGNIPLALGGRHFHADIAMRPLARAPGIGLQTGSVQYGGSPLAGDGTQFFDFGFDNVASSSSIDFTFFGNASSSYLQIYFGISTPFVGTVYLDNILIF